MHNYTVLSNYSYLIVKVHSRGGDTDYFDIVAGVLQRDTLTHVSISCLDYVLRTNIDEMKGNCFKLKRKESVQTITDAD